MKNRPGACCSELLELFKQVIRDQASSSAVILSIGLCTHSPNMAASSREIRSKFQAGTFAKGKVSCQSLSLFMSETIGFLYAYALDLRLQFIVQK